MAEWIPGGAQVQGALHQKKQMPCQDYVTYHQEGGCVCVALADGAGSARYSHIGAKGITQKMASCCCNRFEALIDCLDGVSVKKELMDCILAEIQQIAGRIRCDMSDLASTLLVVAVKDNRFLLFHLGDGVIGYMKDGAVKVATHPVNGECPNETVFTTSPDAIRSMRLIKGTLEGIEGFMLISDGVEACLYHKTKKILAPAVKTILEDSAGRSSSEASGSLQDFLEKIASKRSYDDCSMGILVQKRKDGNDSENESVKGFVDCEMWDKQEKP